MAGDEKKKPTNLLSNRHPVHRWANFIAGYSPELVSTAIQDARLNLSATILDPFAGQGTTLIQGLFEGLNVTGAEANPYFADITAAKCLSITKGYDYDEVFNLLRDVKPAATNILNSLSADSLKYLTKLFPEASLRLLISARNQEHSIKPSSRPLFRLVVSCLLEELSSSQTDGIYKAPTTIKRAKGYQDTLLKLESMMIYDSKLITMRRDAHVQLHKGSAVDLNPLDFGHADICVTSPPYLNNFDYAEMSRMELYFWNYASSWKEITDRFRALQVPNTTTVPSEIKKHHHQHRNSLSEPIAARLDAVVASLEAAKNQRDGSKDYHRLVYPYFGTMQTIFQNCFRILRRGSPIHVIIGDAYLYGIHIPTGEVMKDILAEIGFIDLELRLIRTRGTRWILAKREGAGTPIGEYEIYGIRR